MTMVPVLRHVQAARIRMELEKVPGVRARHEVMAQEMQKASARRIARRAAMLHAEMRRITPVSHDGELEAVRRLRRGHELEALALATDTPVDLTDIRRERCELAVADAVAQERMKRISARLRSLR